MQIFYVLSFLYAFFHFYKIFTLFYHFCTLFFHFCKIFTLFCHLLQKRPQIWENHFCRVLSQCYIYYNLLERALLYPLLFTRKGMLGSLVTRPGRPLSSTLITSRSLTSTFISLLEHYISSLLLCKYSYIFVSIFLHICDITSLLLWHYSLLLCYKRGILSLIVTNCEGEGSTLTLRVRVLPPFLT
jgi:hypothetical protein